MQRTFIAAVAFAAAAGSAFADDITVETSPFVSNATRAEVQADFAAARTAGVSPASNRYDPLAHFQSERSRAAVTAEYIAARDRVAAFTAEDSGSAYLAQQRAVAAIKLAAQ